MARVMASELSPRNIRVNVVSPGGTSTPIWNRNGADAGGYCRTGGEDREDDSAWPFRQGRGGSEDRAVPRFR